MHILITNSGVALYGIDVVSAYPQLPVNDAQTIRERAAARTQHVAKDQPLQHLFRHGWADLESRAKSGEKARD